ncbi:MAG: hypothetical protein AAGD96_22970 [Chloroflexota bacterium]
MLVELKPIFSVPITNARRYFFKRLAIHLAIKFPIFSSLIRLFNHRHSVLSVRDVEQIFYICNCERESENIHFIRSIAANLHLENILDIGSNFGQFVSAISSSFVKGICVDANPAAVEFLGANSVLDHFEKLNFAVIPNNLITENAILKIPKGNTGKALIGTLDGEFESVSVPTAYVRTISDRLPSSGRRLIKFDIEGLEPDLVKDYLSLERKTDVIAFEVLTFEAKEKLNNAFKDQKEPYRFFTLRYSFLANSGFMGENKLDLMRMFLSGNATLDVYAVDDLDMLPFVFMSLVFAIPKSLLVEGENFTLNEPLKL